MRTILAKLSPQGIDKVIVNLKILIFSIYKIIERQGSSELPVGVIWLKNHGIRMPKNLDFYAVCFFVPFMFSVGYGLFAQAEMFDRHYGLNNLVVAIIFVSLLILADYYHSMNYFHINLQFFKLIPISNSRVFKLKLLVELFGYKLYLLFCAISMLGLFNWVYVEGITFCVHPKTLIFLIDIYLLYGLIGLLFKHAVKIAMHPRWVEFSLKLVSVLIVIALLSNVQQFKELKEYISLKNMEVMNERFWFIHVIISTLICASYLTMVKLIDWKK